jgi:type VI secretion system protein ImpK
MSGNPFSEPGDNERTIILRPSPGGMRPGTGGGPPAPGGGPPTSPGEIQGAGRPAEAAFAADAGEPLVTGQSPLIVAATPLLRLLGRLRNTLNPPDPGALRVRILQAVRDFETACRATGVPHEAVHPARYALCASIDDAVMHTPWGEASTWQQASLVSTLHKEVVAGEGFFYQLSALKREPARNLALLELMYVCLSLGYMGQYRLSPRGPAELEMLREDLYQTLVRLRPGYERALSVQWKGADAPFRAARMIVPAWVMAVAVAAVLGLSWLFLSVRLNAAASEAARIAAAGPPGRMADLTRPPLAADSRPVVPDVATPAPPIMVALHSFLEPEIKAGLVEVSETPTTVKVRIFSSGMFAIGKAEVRPDLISLLERIGGALNDEAGKVLVAGHTDDTPIIHPIPFRSNYELSVARAEAARDIIGRTIRDPGRLTAKGFSDTQPVHDNATDPHRTENRRIDVILQRVSN